MGMVDQKKADTGKITVKRVKNSKICIHKTKGLSRNRGIAIVEITLLIPVLLGCIYFFIMTMLYMIRQAQAMDNASDCVYESQENESSDAQKNMNFAGNATTYKQGNTRVIEYKEEWNGYDIYVELRVDDSDPVKNLRRWQLVSDTIR